MATTATQKVFGICELAEQIFLELSMKDLLLVQRVCKPWQTTIQSSSVCRKALFLEPGRACDVNIEENDPHAHETKAKCSTCAFLPEDLDRFKHDVVFNPLLMQPSRFSAYLRSHLHCSPYDKIFPHTELLEVSPEASCRKMFITQPPLPFATSAIGLVDKSACKGKTAPPEGMTWNDLGRVVSWDEASPGCLKVLGGGHTFGEILESLRKSIRPSEEICRGAFPFWAVTWTGEQSTWKNKVEKTDVEDGAKQRFG
ncbi:hypothetical protein HII31_06722 [Pseudocercospora fuligena]|uniref:F-box domain-containing protein n=1 Tax=Pseudocercospora fuligena TaxID=685502 RepID=A0A8H6RJD3_9PEZI|nr:hypothetical protein HII31_06722 [Pseudocercospora fuligena]